MIGKPDEDMAASAEYTRQARLLQKPLFIPLKSKYFEEFKAGTKDTEYRQHGDRWNEDTCPVGRPVVLSKGYGKSQRLTGVITAFDVLFLRSDDFVACYGAPGWAACIRIRLTDAVGVEPR